MPPQTGAGSRFRSIQNDNQDKQQINNIIHQQNVNASPNTSIDVGQLPIRLMSQQKNTARKGTQRNATIQTPSQIGQLKNAWQSIDTTAEIQN